jgi:kynurenine formamidase
LIHPKDARFKKVCRFHARIPQWGRHVDPPPHFVKGLRTVDQIDPKEMILPLVLVDVHREAAADPD